MSSKNKTMKELQVIAKERGMRGYSKLRKAELITLLRHGGVIGEKQSLLYEPVPNISVPILQPTKPEVFTHVGAIENNLKSKVSTFADWLLTYVLEPIKKKVNTMVEPLKSQVNSIFNKFYKNKPTLGQSKTEIKGFAKQYVIDGIAGAGAVTFFNSAKAEVVNLLSRNRQTKVNMVLSCEMERVDMESGEVIITTIPFVSKTEVVLEGTDVKESYNRASDKMLESMAMFQMRGSNWRLKSVNRLEINTVAYTPLEGKSYIPLPAELAAKKAIVNMKNEDNQCFKWCVTEVLNPVENHLERITKELREQAEQLNWSGIGFPVPVNENVISRFERNNNVGVNIFGHEKSVYPLILSEHGGEKVIDLLLISNGEKKHYCWIKNFNKLLAARIETCHLSIMHYCKRCLTGYRKHESLNRHIENCSQNDAQ